MQRILLFGVVGSVTLLVAIGLVAHAIEPSRMPRDWDLADIAEAMKESPDDDGPVRVLAWIQAYPADTPAVSCEFCLVIREGDRDKEYLVNQLVRRRGSKEWQSYFGVGHQPRIARFDHRPGNRDLYDAMDSGDVVWTFDSDPDVTVTNCGVCEKNWFDVTGEPPTRFFRRRSNQGWFPWSQSKWHAMFGGTDS